jgi:hypothetical protein
VKKRPGMVKLGALEVTKDLHRKPDMLLKTRILLCPLVDDRLKSPYFYLKGFLVEPIDRRRLSEFWKGNSLSRRALPGAIL